MNFKSIRFEIFLAIFAVVLISMLGTVTVWYLTEIKLRKEQMVEKSLIALQPIISLAAKNVEGGNLMKLKNAAAQDLYKVNKDLFFLGIHGVSAGAPETEYSAKIPPQRVDYDYFKQDSENRNFSALIDQFVKSGAFKNSNFFFDKDSGFLFFLLKLDVTETGILTAAISGQMLEGIWLTVFQKISVVFVLLLGGAVLIANYMGSRISKTIVETVNQVTHIAKSLDLTTEVKVQTENEFNELAHWFNEFTHRLKKIIASVLDLVSKESASAKEISLAVQNHSAVFAQQSISIAQITSTLTELSASSSEIAQTSSSVVEIAEKSLQESEEGMESVKWLKEKMDEIALENENFLKDIDELGKRSREIGKIMEIINNVVDQTKLISFNALIEAAATGESGRRFEVVAIEIRRLADNVMKSTREIEVKVDETLEGIERLAISAEKGHTNIHKGTQMAAEALSKLQSLVLGAKSSDEMAKNISLSTQQQGMATKQVLEALKEIEGGIKSSSDSIQQTSGIAESLTKFSQKLSELVGHFKVK